MIPVKTKWSFLIIYLSIITLSGIPINQTVIGIPNNISRTWLGPDWWANPLQDWEICDGKIRCNVSKPDRNAFLLTNRITRPEKGFEISALLGFDKNIIRSNKNIIGFRLGINGSFNDYRDDAIYGKGIDIGISSEGMLIFGVDSIKPDYGLNNLIGKGMIMKIKYLGQSQELIISIISGSSSDIGFIDTVNISNPQIFSGGIALLSNIHDTENKKSSSAWFNNIVLAGEGIQHYPGRAWGPVLFSMYTLSDETLKITAQLAPLTDEEGRKIFLEIKPENKWIYLQEVSMDTLSRTASFRIKNWNYDKDIPFRIACKYYSEGEQMEISYWNGIIREEPDGDDELVLAAFTGNNDLGFPNNDLVKNVIKHDPDILFFSGDQIYEGVGGYGFIRLREGDITIPTLDYLRKWYMFGWAYKDVMKERPTLAIPDDHDVYQSNIWGDGGRKATTEGTYVFQQTSGGYMMPPVWINMVQRTQTSHLPDPFDSIPIEQGIEVYYTSMNYAGVSFAILEDRKFKSGPQFLLPEAKIWNGWPQNPEFNSSTQSDVKDARLLGERQLYFLEEWGKDWSDNIKMKAVLSQTIFGNVATIPDSAMSDEIVPKMKILEPGEYPEGDKVATDMDANAWPKTGRDKAVNQIRKAFAVHIAGDQHLGSTVQYGIENYGDASFAFCVPAISNIWPRRWFPPESNNNNKSSLQDYTGEYEDGFGNKLTVYAVSNPHKTGKKPSRLYDRATGFGIIRFDKINREITFECWPRWADPENPEDKQYNGWPVRFHQYDNYISDAPYLLPPVIIKGLQDPVVKVIEQETGNMVYSIRINGTSFQPKVYNPGYYTIMVGDPDLDKWKEYKGLRATMNELPDIIRITFN